MNVMIEGKKASILLVLKVLEEYSDEEHYLTQQEIIDKIDQLYGITLERKSVANSLMLLEEIGYDINKQQKGGYALLSRLFEPEETKYVVDALFSSKALSSNAAQSLANKLISVQSRYNRQDYRYIYKSSQINRTNNKEIFYNLYIIREALKENKRIGFNYIDYDNDGKEILRKDGFEYIVSPYYLVNNFGQYYLLANYNSGYRPFNVFKVNRITNIIVKDKFDYKPIEEELPRFDIAKYINEHIYLFNGEVVEAILQLDGRGFIGYIYEYFGKNAEIFQQNDHIFAKVKCDENALFYFCMQYSENIIVVSPDKLKQRVIDEAKHILERYNNE